MFRRIWVGGRRGECFWRVCLGLVTLWIILLVGLIVLDGGSIRRRADGGFPQLDVQDCAARGE